jgi:predicted glycogen debranching enzyme
LVTNRLGGFASCTIAGICTRRYHGWLIAAHPAPLGRVVLLTHLWEEIRLPSGAVLRLGGDELAGQVHVHGVDSLADFHLELGLPVWRFTKSGVTIEKRVLMPRMQNTTLVRYQLLGGAEAVTLRLRPALNFRRLETAVGPIRSQYELAVAEGRVTVSEQSGFPPLRMLLLGGGFERHERTLREVLYPVEALRGYDHEGELWSPGVFDVQLRCGGAATFCASTESWETALALDGEEALRAEAGRRERLLSFAPPAAGEGWGPELVLAADHFVFAPAGRPEGTARAHAEGDEFCSVIAGYHWFGDWGRDTMISLEGLLLLTGRHVEAAHVLTAFARYVVDGLLPNMFPEGGTGRYNTADASLWFFHALERYLAVTGDRALLQRLLPKLKDIIGHHVAGTRFGIHVDPRDGLLTQGDPQLPLTWMDALYQGHIITPRRGKAVEVNALWYNALRLFERWLREDGAEAEASEAAQRAEHAADSFNRRFWSPDRGYLFDVVDGDQGDDDACRPNQVLAISLPHPVLDERRWRPVLEVVERELLTPFGLRSLAPGARDYHPRYFGHLWARDAAYHQGTVWPWLIGPYVDAYLKVHPGDVQGARALLAGFESHLGEAGLGGISEIFDAEPPFTARGCIAQAWSVAEVLRSWINTGPGEAVP